MSAYIDASRADALLILFQRHELSLDDLIREAVSAVVERNILELSYSDGSELRFPYIPEAA